MAGARTAGNAVAAAAAAAAALTPRAGCMPSLLTQPGAPTGRAASADGVAACGSRSASCAMAKATCSRAGYLNFADPSRQKECPRCRGLRRHPCNLCSRDLAPSPVQDSASHRPPYPGPLNASRGLSLDCREPANTRLHAREKSSDASYRSRYEEQTGEDF